MVSSCSCTARTSPTVVALARMVRYCWRLACSAVMRDCRSTYWPVTSVALVVRSDVLPSACARLQHGGEVVHRHLQRHAARRGAAARRARLGLRVGHEAAVGAGQRGQLRHGPARARRGRRSGRASRSARSWRTGRRRRWAGSAPSSVSRAGALRPLAAPAARAVGAERRAAGLRRRRRRRRAGRVVVVVGPAAVRRGHGRAAAAPAPTVTGRVRRAAHERADRAGQDEQRRRGRRPPRARGGGRPRAAGGARRPGGPARPRASSSPAVVRRRRRSSSASPSPGGHAGRRPPGPGCRRRPAAGTSKAAAGAGEERGEAVVVEHGHRSGLLGIGGAVPGAGQGAQGGVGRQAAAGLVQAGLHRARAPADGQRDVALAQVGVVAQDDRDAQRQGQPLQRGQHGLGHLALLGAAPRGRRRGAGTWASGSSPARRSRWGISRRSLE